MFRCVVRLEGDLRVRHAFGRVEHPQFHSGPEEPDQRCVEVGVGQESHLHRLLQAVVLTAAVEVGASFHSQRRSFRTPFHDLVCLPDVPDGSAVRHHVALKAPLAAEDVGQQEAAAATRVSAETVVRTHDRVRARPADAHFEGGEVGAPEVVVVDDCVEGVPLGLGTRVHGEVFGRGHDFQVVRIVALHAAHELHSQAAGEVGILAVGLHSAPPARIAEDVDVGRPKGQSLVLAAEPVAHELVVLGAGFVRDDRGDFQHQIGIPRGGQADGLREDGGDPGPRHTVQGLAPPVVGGDVETLDRLRRVDHLRHLLFEGHPGHQVLNALIHRQVGVEVGWLLSTATASKQKQRQQRHGLAHKSPPQLHGRSSGFGFSLPVSTSRGVGAMTRQLSFFCAWTAFARLSHERPPGESSTCSRAPANEVTVPRGRVECTPAARLC